MPYIGRFAPSPTGPLHFGSLVAALASWLDAKHAGGRWLVRMEDLDQPRQVPGAAEAILHQLERLGLHWDGAVEYQSRRGELYDDALRGIAGWTYSCGCTRKEFADSALAMDGSRVYPGTCRGGLAPGKPARTLRLRTDAVPVKFTDRVQGEIAQSVEAEVGDFVLRRADGPYAYQLAVVVDDAAQGVTDVVRGADLLDSTARQIVLQRRLGVATPRYLHVPVAVNDAGEKLSKQTQASEIGPQDLAPALAYLGFVPPADLAPSELLAWGRTNWSAARVPRARTLIPSSFEARSP